MVSSIESSTGARLMRALESRLRPSTRKAYDPFSECRDRIQRVADLTRRHHPHLGRRVLTAEPSVSISCTNACEGPRHNCRRASCVLLHPAPISTTARSLIIPTSKLRCWESLDSRDDLHRNGIRRWKAQWDSGICDVFGPLRKVCSPSHNMG